MGHEDHTRPCREMSDAELRAEDKELDLAAIRRTMEALLAGQFPLDWNSRIHGTNILALLDALDAARAEIAAKDAEIAGIVAMIEKMRDEIYTVPDANNFNDYMAGFIAGRLDAANAILAAIKGGKHA